MSFIHCKHYNGRELFFAESDGKCRAGVNPILSFADGNLTGWVRKVPCLRTNETDAICPAAEYPTQEESDQQDAEVLAAMDRFIVMLGKVRPAIEAQHTATGKWAGSLDCPQCAKPLHWSKAKCNGHIHARCETEECVAWME